MPVSNPFPLNIADKIDSPELAAWFAQFGIQYYLNADNINKMLLALQYLYENQGSGGGGTQLKFIRQKLIFTDFTTLIPIPPNAKVSTVTNKDSPSKVIEFTQTESSLKINDNCEAGDTLEIIFN